MRHIREGREIPTESYADQPYVVKTDDGAWLVCLTTGSGKEGDPGQHVVTMRSTDQGKTWTQPVDVEPADGPEASYAVMLKVPSGRIYIFYNHNTDNLRSIQGDSPPYKDGIVRRVDSIGYFVFKYSDDHGRTWSRQRYNIPVREFEIDRKNVYQGKVRFFWNVGKAFLHKGAGYVPLHKVGGFGEGFFTSSEGVLLRSTNILTETDPTLIRWETLPDGDVGLRTPPGGGTIAEEQSFVELSDGSLYVVYRTIDGHPVESYSRDGGRTWEPPQYLRYANGRLVKHPRAANFVWKCENGKYLYWFHNHGGRFIREHPRVRSIAYNDRNPVWLSGGIEADSPRGKVLRWSQPEILLYEDDPSVRMSYPDLVEHDGKYFVTETQKEIARVHEIDTDLLKGLWGEAGAKPSNQPGLTLRFELQLNQWQAGLTLLDNRDAQGRGLAVVTLPEGKLEAILNDGRTENRWPSEGVFSPVKRHKVALIVDHGPKILLWISDGRLHDGGDERQFGWGRYHPALQLPQLLENRNWHQHSEVRGFAWDTRALRIQEYLRTAVLEKEPALGLF